MKKYFLFSILAIFTVLNLSAQTMIAEKMSAAPMDLSASVNKRVDFNGNPCALIKVSVIAPNVTFGGNVIGNVSRDGSDYWVYVTSGTKMLQIKHPNFKTLIVTFPDLGIAKVEGKQTYLLDITLPYFEGPIAVSEPSDAKATASPKKQETKTTDYVPRKFKGRKVKDYTALFFPIHGITPGKTTAKEALKMGYKKEDGYMWDKYRFIENVDLTFWSGWNLSNADIETYCRIGVKKIPKQWADEFNISHDMSYNEWMAFFKSIGCRIDVSKEPMIRDFDGEDVMAADFRATTPDGKYYFNLRFDYGRKGTTPYSPGTLYEIEIIAPANDLIASRLAPSKNASKHVKPSTSIDLLFPIYGVTLGKTTWKDMADAGFNVKFKDDDSVVGEALGVSFWDHDKKMYFNDLYVTNASNMPADWVKIGFQWGNSYDTWVKLLRDLGYNVIVKESPKVSEYLGRKVLEAELTAISRDNRLKMDLYFNYGDGSTTSAPGTLYSIKMYAL